MADHVSAALRKVAASGKLATRLSSAELARIRPAIRERAVFSAKVANAEFLDKISSVTRSVVRGEISPGSAKRMLKAFLDAEGYEPEPGEAGKITDLSSDARLRLIVQTNAGMAKGYAKHVAAQKDLDRRPWQELFRQYQRKEPRDWPARWRAAGGTVRAGRMVAEVNSPVWTAISAFGLPYPPFDFNSGMGVRTLSERQVGRKAARQMPKPPPDFNAGLQSDVLVEDDRIRRQLLRDLGPGYTTRGKGRVLRRQGS